MSDLECADDMALLDNWEDLTVMLSSLATHCRALGLTISCKKTKCLAVLPSQSNQLLEAIQLSPSDDPIEIVSYFQYFGSVMYDNCNSDIELS